MFYITLAALENEDERTEMAVFYERTKGICLHVAMGITHNQSLAEEAMQEAFVKMIERKQTFFGCDPSKRKALILVVVKNAAIDILRRNNKPIDELLNESGEETLSDGFDIGADYESREYISHLKECIEKLPNDSRNVFTMKYVHGMSYAKISEMIDITVDLVGVRISRAKSKLLKIIREGEENDGKRDK